MERKYEFRKRLLDVHMSNIGCASDVDREGFCRIDEDFTIVAPKNASRLLRYVATDLREFFEVSLGMSVRVRFTDEIPSGKCIVFDTETTVDSEKNLAFRLSVASDKITICGKTERGIAQGSYLLEDYMKKESAPYIPIIEKTVEPMFSPRMTHSGYQIDFFPDAYLKSIAHAGMDAIIVYVSDLYKCHNGFVNPDALWKGTCQGFCDFNELIYRAEGFGLDVYVYSHYKCDMHPSDEGAREYYENSFGRLFAEFPKIKGIIFVGETFEFPSNDPHTIGKRCQLKTPDDKGSNVGWYPCCDYPELVTLVKDVIRSKNPDADIVFWSYNWGYQPADIRLELIRNLPRDISLLVTYDMFERFESEEDIADYGKASYGIADYSISFEGPGKYFVSEAEEAKRLGIRLYAMANTGGKTWDIGVVPYLPFPYQWARRCVKLAESHDSYGLSGLMESHHYGWAPSFVSEVIKYAFANHSEGIDGEIEAIARRDFGENAHHAIKAWSCFSEAIKLIIASSLDQYGPFRIGPSYPLVFDQTDVDMLSVPYGEHSGNAICFPYYRQDVLGDPKNAIFYLRRNLRAVELYEEGNAHLVHTLEGQTGSKLEYAKRHYALCKFIENTYRTAVNVKKWTMMKSLLFSSAKGEADKYPALWDEISGFCESRTIDGLKKTMKAVAECEIANAEATVEYCETDSLIGYEPSMEYMCSREHIQWKIDTVKESIELMEKY